MDPLANGGIYSGGNAPTGSVGPIGSAGTGSRPNAPIVTPPDIQINSGMSLDKKPKKGLIIGGILAVVLLIVAVIFGVMSMNRSGGNGGGSADFGYNQFLIYANYLLNGSENTAAIGNYDEDADYTVVDAYFDEDKEYMETLKGVWDNFYNKFMASEKAGQKSPVLSAVEYQNELMDFISKNSTIIEYDDEELMKLYASVGLEEAGKQVENRYNTILTSIYPSGRQYAMSLINNAKAGLKLYSDYDGLGCFVNGAIDDVCIERNAEAANRAYSEYVNNEEAEVRSGLVDEAVDMLIDNCFSIDDELGGGR